VTLSLLEVIGAAVSLVGVVLVVVVVWIALFDRDGARERRREGKDPRPTSRRRSS
jgi:hypothetical protein